MFIKIWKWIIGFLSALVGVLFIKNKIAEYQKNEIEEEKKKIEVDKKNKEQEIEILQNQIKDNEIIEKHKDKINEMQKEQKENNSIENEIMNAKEGDKIEIKI
jgi:uncharacterized transporter YbjL